ncbi:MAG: TRAP transporter small permease, partial [Planctomycetes bacterium]|nr:TRAP transporter small permease [Planctomycetota bacterium]
MRTVFALHRRLQSAINWLIGVALLGLLTVILLQTFTRYVIFYSLPWSEELSRYLFVLMVLLGINIGITRENFVRIDAIDGLIPRAAPFLAVFRDLVALAVSVVMAYSALPLIRIGKFQKSPAMQIGMNIM